MIEQIKINVLKDILFSKPRQFNKSLTIVAELFKRITFNITDNNVSSLLEKRLDPKSK